MDTIFIAIFKNEVEGSTNVTHISYRCLAAEIFTTQVRLKQEIHGTFCNGNQCSLPDFRT